MKEALYIKKRFPHAAAILLVILVIAMMTTWVLPSVSFETVHDESTGINMIDESTVKFSTTNKIMPWELPRIVVSGVENVLSTIVLICVFMGAFAIMTASGMFDAFISHLCRRFSGREIRLVVLIMTGFSILGLVVMPHCFIAFVPTVIMLAISMGFDALVGLAMVLFGATTASMTGPLSAVTAMCQDAVGLPIFSGAGVRFILFGIFHVINVTYLVRYAKKVKRDPSKSIMGDYSNEQALLMQKEKMNSEEKSALSKRFFVASALLVAAFAVSIYGSTALAFSTNDISGTFVVFALLVGPVLGFSISDTIRHFIDGVRGSASTLVVISLAGAITSILKRGGVFSTLVYYSSKVFSVLPGFLVPVALLIIVGIMNCILPSGPAKGVMLMPLIGPIGQLSGVTMQTTVLTYNLGDSFSNYLLPYDATNASYLEAARVPFNIWVKFVLRLFVIWNIVGSVLLIIIYFLGYGPF